jgi:hypothetical protein
MHIEQGIRINLVGEEAKSLGKESFERADQGIQIKEDCKKKRAKRDEKTEEETKNV